MGTRNLTIVRDENLLFGQYGQWDGYPEGNGVGVLTFLKRQMAFQQFRQAVKRIVVASQERLEELARADIDKDTHPQFFRGLGTGILDFIADGTGPVEVHNQIDFAADSLFCEWAYMVDLVERKLRCFKGFNKSPLTESDFFYFLSDKSRGGYYPILGYLDKWVPIKAFRATKGPVYLVANDEGHHCKGVEFRVATPKNPSGGLGRRLFYCQTKNPSGKVPKDLNVLYLSEVEARKRDEQKEKAEHELKRFAEKQKQILKARSILGIE